MAYQASASGAAGAETEERDSAPITIPDVVRKPKKTAVRSRKPVKKGRKVKTKPEHDGAMTRDEMLSYFTNLQHDPNFSILPFPRFVQESNPELFAQDTPENFRERMKRIDFVEALDRCKTEEERDALKKAREKELKQVVPHYSKLPVDQPLGLKG